MTSDALALHAEYTRAIDEIWEESLAEEMRLAEGGLLFPSERKRIRRERRAATRPNSKGVMTMIRYALAIMILAATAPAVAQEETRCVDIFTSADVNHDGLLSATEIANAEGIPPELQNCSNVTLAQFLAACFQR